ncbi:MULTISPECIES: DUF481 domain-containing protein [unclassified Lentimicrobium]|uniref:DUF481 domain-containing protein n=1 Tax=unclassified Lentimicrobium TaxID=2677434 RepID=UPI001551E5C8|nr:MULTISPECIES: DUF481 domain-containing protein [unclassified Lentimicrobium]NPD44405.1 DUF481 domain-containing protein [Lentimicrobium sp. S6]NPD84329.1 DUF481 domain-containing protein [Lentimicrobium sp. L6]
MKHHIIYILLLLCLILPLLSYAQSDTLITKDQTRLYGEIKQMERGVLIFKTSYSEKDFQIEWLEISQVISTRNFRVTLNSGERLFGKIQKDTTNHSIRITDYVNGMISTEIEDVVYLKQVDDGKIFDIMNLSLDFGYSFTKTNNLHQLNSNIHADYYRIKWGIASSFNVIRNVQDNAPSTKRTTGMLDFKYFMKNDFFSSAIANYYSNTEQQLDLRSTYNLSIGQYLIHTNKVYFNYSFGIAYTLENFVDNPDNPADLNSIEGTLKLEYNMFDMGDLSMFTNITVYPSFSERGRVRMISKVSAKYELPRDFYIRGTFDYNIDNKPISDATPEDYVYTVGLGWEL